MALRVSVGQYYSADSPIHELDPRAKVALTLVYMVSCFFVANPAMLALSGAFVFAAIAASRVPVRLLLRSVRTIMFFLVFTSVFNLFFVQTGQVLLSAGPVAFTYDGVWAAALYTLRFLFLLLMGALLMCTTTPIALTDAAEDLLAPLARLGLPVHDAALIMSIALRFVPTLSREAENIVAAQTARGADLENKEQRAACLCARLRSACCSAFCERAAPCREPRPRYGRALLRGRCAAHPLPRHALRARP